MAGQRYRARSDGRQKLGDFVGPNRLTPHPLPCNSENRTWSGGHALVSVTPLTLFATLELQ